MHATSKLESYHNILKNNVLGGNISPIYEVVEAVNNIALGALAFSKLQ